MPIQDEKHEVVLFLCSHKDITKQKLHEQQQKVAAAAALHQQQLAFMNEQQQQQQQSDQQKQLQLNHSDLAQGAKPPGSPASAEAPDLKQQQQQQLQLASPSGQPADGPEDEADGREREAARGRLEAEQLQQLQQLQALQRQEHDDQQALISMEEFCIDELDDDDGEPGERDEDDEHGDKNTASQYSRRRSRAVLYQLSGHYGYRRSVNMKSKLKLNNVSIPFQAARLFTRPAARSLARPLECPLPAPPKPRGARPNERLSRRAPRRRLSNLPPFRGASLPAGRRIIC